MSVKVMGLVWDQDDRLESNRRFVMVALADHADHNGKNAYPGIELLARKTGYTERSVQRILQSLILEGWISADRRSGGRGILNGYSFNMEMLRAGLRVPLATQSDGGVRKGDKITPFIQENKDDKITPFPEERMTSTTKKDDIHDTPLNKNQILNLNTTQQGAVFDLADYFTHQCKSVKGFTPVVTEPDRKLLDSLLRKYPDLQTGIKSAQELISWFLKSPESDRMSPSLSVCLSSFVVNKWRLTASGKTGTGKSIDAAGRELKPLL